MKNYFSLLSILIALVVIALKIELDLATYHAFQDAVSAMQNSVQPAMVVGGLTFLPISLVVVSLVLAVFGLEKNNKYRFFALTLNVIAIFYLMVPIGMFLVKPM